MAVLIGLALGPSVTQADGTPSRLDELRAKPSLTIEEIREMLPLVADLVRNKLPGLRLDMGKVDAAVLPPYEFAALYAPRPAGDSRLARLRHLGARLKAMMKASYMDIVYLADDNSDRGKILFSEPALRRATGAELLSDATHELAHAAQRQSRLDLDQRVTREAEARLKASRTKASKRYWQREIIAGNVAAEGLAVHVQSVLSQELGLPIRGPSLLTRLATPVHLLLSRVGRQHDMSYYDWSDIPPDRLAEKLLDVWKPVQPHDAREPAPHQAGRRALRKASDEERFKALEPFRKAADRIIDHSALHRYVPMVVGGHVLSAYDRLREAARTGRLGRSLTGLRKQTTGRSNRPERMDAHGQL